MILSKKIIIKYKHSLFKELDNLAFLSKNLYNSTLYVARQSFLQGEYRNYYSINKEFTHTKQVDYISLPAKVAKQTQMLVDKNFNSFFALLKKKKVSSYDKKIKLPKYLHKIEGRQVVIYPKDALSFKKEGYIKLSKTSIYIPNDIEKNKVRQVRIVPFGCHYTIEILYEKESKEYEDNKEYAGIDLGINNLMTITGTVFNPYIINGRPIKSINRYYNKLIAHKQGKLPKGKYTSRAIKLLWLRRNNKIDDYLQKSSNYVMNQLVSKGISNLVIGYNKEWKQDINMGKVNNQKFVMIPHNKLVGMLEYKGELVGIKVIKQEESYTSKCSYIEDEEVVKKDDYGGKRVSRGLYISKSDIELNADVNGSMNIVKKYLQKEGKWESRYYVDLLENFCKVEKVVLKTQSQ